MKEATRRWRLKNRDKRLAMRRRFYTSVKATVIAHYGGVCCLCGTDDLEVLNIDHIHKRHKQKDRMLLGKKLAGIYASLKKRRFPKGYRVLCFNCNFKEYLRRLREERS